MNGGNAEYTSRATLTRSGNAEWQGPQVGGLQSDKNQADPGPLAIEKSVLRSVNPVNADALLKKSL
ncbi:MAG: hypothetical protein Q8K12_14460 [Thiobacillus sp.]|nr:hypothetical protein [Thiobacillus sp.]